ncbi:hypothetical protein HDU76_010445, partial [Blyttiomyces sp. JEL0837]
MALITAVFVTTIPLPIFANVSPRNVNVHDSHAQYRRAAAAANAVGACKLEVPPNPLTAKGLSTPWLVSGVGCQQANMTTFVECTVVDTTNGNLFVYNPLVVDGTAQKAAQKFIPPVVPTLPAQSVVGCWMGTNGASTTLVDVNGSLKQGNCVSGAPGVANDNFLQFASCGGKEFFAAVNALPAGAIQIPPLGMGKNNKPCYTARSFELVDMDQSDNMVTTYLLSTNGTIGQANTANRMALTDAKGNPPTEVNNGSDNLLLDQFLRPALGCTPYLAMDLANPGAMTGSLALNEIQAAAQQMDPIAL